MSSNNAEKNLQDWTLQTYFSFFAGYLERTKQADDQI